MGSMPYDGSTPLPNAQGRWERFAKEYIIDLNGSAAYLRAGYDVNARVAESNSSRLLRNAEVKRRIDHLRDQRSSRTEVTSDYVVTSLKEVAERCMQRVPVMVRRGREMVQAQDEEGRDVWKFDSTGANGALKLLGQHLGLFGAKGTKQDPQYVVFEWPDQK